MKPKCIDARFLTVEARAWTQILSHYVLPCTHKSSFMANLALLVWCVLTERPVNILPLVKQAMGQVHARGNLPFLALVSDLVATASIPWEDMDTKAIIPAKGNVVLINHYFMVYIVLNCAVLSNLYPFIHMISMHL